jgi:hypothetical protein
MVDTERTLKQGLGAVLSYADPSPTCRSPSSLTRADQGPAAKDFVLVSLDGFAFPESIRANILDVGIVGEDIVIRLELQLDPLSVAVQFEGEIKV